MDFGFSSGVGSVISGTVSTASGFVSSTGLVNTSIYYKGTPISDEELACKEIIDHLHTDNPAWGARQMSAQLKARGYHVGRRKARRYMNEMDIYPIYPKMNLSKRMQQAKVCPYLLRNAVMLYDELDHIIINQALLVLKCIHVFRIPNCFFVPAETSYCQFIGKIGRSA